MEATVRTLVVAIILSGLLHVLLAIVAWPLSSAPLPSPMSHDPFIQKDWTLRQRWFGSAVTVWKEPQLTQHDIGHVEPSFDLNAVLNGAKPRFAEDDYYVPIIPPKPLTYGSLLPISLIPKCHRWPPFSTGGPDESGVATTSHVRIGYPRRWRVLGGEGKALAVDSMSPLYFAQNTLITSAFLLIVTLCFRDIRRRLRRQNSQCEACGYRLLSIGSVCPECGN